MGTAFNNFLSNRAGGASKFTNFKSYTHATKLYVDNNFARAPKLGFLYFVSFNINSAAIKNWPNDGQRDVGLLVKKADQPKFKIATETINQYNRKTNVQTKITYEPISIEFHDDNSEITNNLWINYFKYYYEDSNYRQGMMAYGDTKYGSTYYRYGLDNNQDEPFFESVDIFVLHQHKFTQITIENPLITAWDHDSLSQSEGTKVLQNKMTLAYENVYYKTGEIVPGSSPDGFAAKYYDNVASPLQAGKRNPDGTQVSINDVFGKPQPASNISPIPTKSGPSLSQLDKVKAQQPPRYGAPQASQAGKGIPIIPTYKIPNQIGVGTVGLTTKNPSYAASVLGVGTGLTSDQPTYVAPVMGEGTGITTTQPTYAVGTVGADHGWPQNVQPTITTLGAGTSAIQSTLPTYASSTIGAGVAGIQSYIPAYGAPAPMGAGTLGVGYLPPSGFRIFGLNLWYGHGGIHGKVNIGAGPINLVLRK